MDIYQFSHCLKVFHLFHEKSKTEKRGREVVPDLFNKDTSKKKSNSPSYYYGLCKR